MCMVSGSQMKRLWLCPVKPSLTFCRPDIFKAVADVCNDPFLGGNVPDVKSFIVRLLKFWMDKMVTKG